MNYWLDRPQANGSNAYRTAVLCPDCGGELVQRVHGRWCARCRGWLRQQARMNGSSYLYIQNSSPKHL